MLSRIVDLLFPPQCAVCRRIGSGLCEECAPPRAPLVQRTLEHLEVVALGEYRGAYRAAVLALKDGRRDVAESLGDRLGAVVPPSSILVPVRTTRARVRMRGVDAVETIARRAAKRSGAELLTPLAYIRGAGQRGKTREARLMARGRFSCDESIVQGRHVMLVDDVCTTGATLEDSARAVRAAGGVVTGALTIAVVLA